MCICVCAWVCAHEHKCLQRPEERAGFFRAGVAFGCDLSYMVLETELESSGRINNKSFDLLSHLSNSNP